MMSHPSGGAMPTYVITHAVEATITHRVIAETRELANAEAVELTFAKMRELEARHEGVSFGAVDDRYGEPKLLPE